MTESELAILYDNLTITVGTLAALTAITTVSKIDTARKRGFRVTRTEWFLTRRGATTGDEAIIVGYAFNQTSGEIGEAIGADPQDNFTGAQKEPNDRAKRPIFPMAVFGGFADAVGSLSVAKGVTKPGWSAPEEGFLNWYALAAFGAVTTGVVIGIHAKHYGVWLRD